MKGPRSELPKELSDMFKAILESIGNPNHYPICPSDETDPHKINLVPRAEGGYWLVEEEDMILFEDELREMEDDY
jgi:hypothetical protein